MKCTVLYALRDHAGQWRSPTSTLTAHLIAGPVSPFMRQMETSEADDELPILLPGEDGPADLWLSDGFAGQRLSASDQLYGWILDGAAPIVAAQPEDLGGALLVYYLANESELMGLGLLESTFTELIAAAEQTIDGDDWPLAAQRIAFSILSARAQAEAVYATTRAKRIAKRAARVAAIL